MSRIEGIISRPECGLPFSCSIIASSNGIVRRNYVVVVVVVAS